MAQNQDQPKGSQSGGQSQGKQQYVVKATFTDDKGKQWTAGTTFQGDEAAIRKAMAASQIEPRQGSQPQDQDEDTA